MLNKIIEFLLKNKTYEEKLFKQYGKARKYKDYNIKILFIADTHNCLYGNSKILEELKKQKDYDFCILLGDHSTNDLNEILQIIPINKIYGVLGNHDGWDKYKQFGINDINQKIININGVKIAGISGSYKYKNVSDYVLYTHEQSLEIADKMEQADILVTHDIPFLCDNHNPVHDGLKGITKYIYKNQIPIHIHGHLHENSKDVLENGTISMGVYLIKIIKI